MSSISCSVPFDESKSVAQRQDGARGIKMALPPDKFAGLLKIQLQINEEECELWTVHNIDECCSKNTKVKNDSVTSVRVERYNAINAIKITFHSE